MNGPAGQMPPWRRRPVAAVLDALKVDPQRGLSSDSVAARRERHGSNEITETARRGPLRMLAGQFADL